MSTKNETTLLGNELTIAEKMALGSLSAHPGYPVLEKMIRAAVDKANAAVMLVLPEDPNYNRILAAAQQEARATNTFALRVLRSIAVHTQHGAQLAKKEEMKVSQGVQDALNSLNRS